MNTPKPTDVTGETITEGLTRKYSHYHKKLPAGMTHVDVYAVLRLFEVEDGAIAHALKKLLCAGKRGAKSREKDLKEARDSITRALELDEAFSVPLSSVSSPTTAYSCNTIEAHTEAERIVWVLHNEGPFTRDNPLKVLGAPPGTAGKIEFKYLPLIEWV